MECKDFQALINDFIYDKIEYSEDLEEFLEHAKSCKQCGEDLSLYYTILRGLGDVPPPDDGEEIMDADRELESIFSFYNEYFEKQRFMKKAGRISVVIFSIVLLCTGVCIYLSATGVI